jgi:hypothetical protein
MRHFYIIGYQVKPNINLVEVHSQLRNNGHPMDGALLGVSLVWP